MKNVLLVFGGKSYEHDISVVTTMQIYRKTKLEHVNLVLLYVSRDERFFVCDSKNVKITDSLAILNSKNCFSAQFSIILCLRLLQGIHFGTVLCFANLCHSPNVQHSPPPFSHKFCDFLYYN